jgi:hypothetical protein
VAYAVGARRQLLSKPRCATAGGASAHSCSCGPLQAWGWKGRLACGCCAPRGRSGGDGAAEQRSSSRSRRRADLCRRCMPRLWLGPRRGALRGLALVHA